MNASRRSIFSLFGGSIAVAAGAAVAAPAKAELRERKYVNGKLICRCDAPEFDAVDEPEMFWQDYGGGSHTHTMTGSSGAHTHTISDPGHTHNFTSGYSFSQQAWRTRTTHHCIFCGGIESEGAGPA